jgi:hypothetical protein
MRPCRTLYEDTLFFNLRGVSQDFVYIYIGFTFGGVAARNVVGASIGGVELSDLHGGKSPYFLTSVVAHPAGTGRTTG